MRFFGWIVLIIAVGLAVGGFAGAMGWIGFAAAVGLTLAVPLAHRGMMRVSGERGWAAGVGYWLGVSTVTVPLTILAFWIVRFFI